MIIACCRQWCFEYRIECAVLYKRHPCNSCRVASVLSGLIWIDWRSSLYNILFDLAIQTREWTAKSYSFVWVYWQVVKSFFRINTYKPFCYHQIVKFHFTHLQLTDRASSSLSIWIYKMRERQLFQRCKTLDVRSSAQYIAFITFKESIYYLILSLQRCT